MCGHIGAIPEFSPAGGNSGRQKIMQNRTHLQSDPKQQELRIREGFFEGLKNVRNNFRKLEKNHTRP